MFLFLFRIIVVQSETFSGENENFENGFENTNAGTIKAANASSLSQFQSQENNTTTQSEFHDKEVNLYILAGHENMQL